MGALPTVVVPIRTVSELNARDGWQARDRRRKRQHRDVGLHLQSKLGIRPPALPVTVTLVRVGKRLLDDDNLRASFKFCRDIVAWYLKTTDDANGGVAWRYGQRIAPAYAVEITIAPGCTP